MNMQSDQPASGSQTASSNRELTGRGEAGVAGVAMRATVGVGLVYRLVHYGCHPDS